jgi:hypothetical protein
VLLALRSFPLADGETQNMADVISISAHQRRGYQPPHLSGAGATIILFPGVRYERPEDTTDEAGEPARSPKGKTRHETRA